jgi:hypothetical protein
LPCFALVAQPAERRFRKSLLDDSHSNEFVSWLQSQNKTRWTVKEIRIYALRFGEILQTGDASSLMTLSPRNRQHAMAALANLAKFQSCYDRWLDIRHRYNLKWSNPGTAQQALERFFNPGLDLDVRIQRVKQMVEVLPSRMGRIIRFACLTGLRPVEAVESVRLVNDRETFAKYYNPHRQALEAL